MKNIFFLSLATLLFCGFFSSCYASDARISTECSDYPTQNNSPYVLPYLTGFAFVVGQGNCTDGSHSEDQQYAYDFDMPIGSTIIAARSGTVITVEYRFVDGNRTSGEENFILIQHDDQTVAGYFHLTHKGALVDVGDTVSKGDIIGLSGDTGDSSEPHLHFEVLECEDCDSLSITFSNTRNHKVGLVEGESYEAGIF